MGKSVFGLVLASLLLLVSFSASAGNEDLTIKGPAEVVCSGIEFQLKASGNSNDTYQWFPAHLFNSASGQKVTTSIRTSTKFTVIRTNNQGVDTATFTVHVETRQISVTGNTYVCKGDSTYLSIGSSNLHPLWNTGEISNSIWVTKPGIYRVEATDGCETTLGEIHVKSISKPLALISTFDDLHICEDESVELGAFGVIDNFTWSTGETERNINVAEEGEVVLTVRNECGVSTDSKFIFKHQVDASFIPSKMSENIPFDLNLFNDSKSKASNQWFVNGVEFSSEENGKLKIDEEGEYEIVLLRTNEYGCEGRMKYSSIVALPPVKPQVTVDELVVFPNSFTPNGDGLNDAFSFQSNYVDQVRFSIIDRWGRLVFESYSNEAWDGRTQSGDIAPEGMYIVQYQFEDLEGKLLNRTMSLNLIR